MVAAGKRLTAHNVTAVSVTVKQRLQQGMVLVTVLWVAAILTILVATVGRTHRVDTKISFFAGQQRRCAWAARAGVETALAMLAEDDPSSDSLDELWSDNDEDYNDVGVGACTLTIQVTDESGKLNINSATRAQLLGLPDMEEEIADAILGEALRLDDGRPRDDATVLVVRVGPAAKPNRIRRLSMRFPL